MKNKRVGLVGALVCGVLGTACEEQASADLGGRRLASDALAEGAEYNTVGALVRIAADGSTKLCTASLIDEEVILTAKHCVLEEASLDLFVQGRSIYAGPRRIIPVDGFTWNKTSTRGLLGHGADVALGFLSRPSTGIDLAIPGHTVITGQQPSTHIWREHDQVGFGLDDGRSAAGVGERRLGRARVYAMQYMQAIPALMGYDYGRFLDDLEAYVEGEGRELSAEAFDELVALFWGGNELTENDLIVDAVNGATLGGDSGGPLMSRNEDGTWTVFGVLAGAISFPGAQDRAIYAALGPEAHHLIDSALGECGSVPQWGTCEGDTATHCSGLDDGDAHLELEVCGSGCFDTPLGARCGESISCTQDADCEAMSPGATCGETGQCTWHPWAECHTEANYRSCVRCCDSIEGADDGLSCEAYCGDLARDSIFGRDAAAASVLSTVGNLDGIDFEGLESLDEL